MRLVLLILLLDRQVLDGDGIDVLLGGILIHQAFFFRRVLLGMVPIGHGRSRGSEGLVFRVGQVEHLFSMLSPLPDRLGGGCLPYPKARKH